MYPFYRKILEENNPVKLKSINYIIIYIYIYIYIAYRIISSREHSTYFYQLLYHCWICLQKTTTNTVDEDKRQFYQEQDFALTNILSVRILFKKLKKQLYLHKVEWFIILLHNYEEVKMYYHFYIILKKERRNWVSKTKNQLCF